MSDRNTKNYMAHGGDELVIGGKLTFLPGATVEGAEGLLDMPQASGASSQQIPFVADSKATSTATLRDDFNRFLAALRTAGLMATTPVVEVTTDDAGTDA